MADSADIIAAARAGDAEPLDLILAASGFDAELREFLCRKATAGKKTDPNRVRAKAVHYQMRELGYSASQCVGYIENEFPFCAATAAEIVRDSKLKRAAEIYRERNGDVPINTAKIPAD